MIPHATHLTKRQIAVKAVPFVIVVLASLAIRTPVAEAYPLIALILFLWVVADTMMLALMARSSGRPSFDLVIGVLAGASVTVWLGSPAAIRETLWSTPVIVAGMVAMVLGHIGWATLRAKRAFSASPAEDNERWIDALSELLPTALVRLAIKELTILDMALFRWGDPVDVPPNARAFAYHKHLAPMCAALLTLSVIELAVYHLLIGHWSQNTAIVMFIISGLGFIYLVGVIKSFRFRPILITPEGIHIRAGILIDRFIPFEALKGIQTSFVGEQIRDAANMNTALLAWPNILLQLHDPLPRQSFLKRKEPFNTISFRLDNPEPFIRILQSRLGEKPI